ncbi:outer membrane protein assembly factor BamC [Kangiella marina]|uniref:Outer membrane protein assembly factor BamC n=1 Tax=Kangiella marina TaxID=1079178 RepID=A0ABP8IQE8_9GAMM
MLNYLRTIKIISLSVSSALLLAACATTDGTEDIDDRYMRSQHGPDLQLPPETSEVKVNDGYRVPEGLVITQREPKGKKLSLDPPQLLLVAGDGVWEDKERAEPTVWVRSSSEELISYVVRFMDSQQMSHQEPTSSSVKTNWISDDDDNKVAEHLGTYSLEGERHKFALTIVETKPNEVALQAQHEAYQQLINDKWVNVDTSSRVAKQFLNYFIGYYDSERTREARARILQEAKIEVELGYNDQGALALVSQREFLAVWDQMPRVLEALNLEVTDRDRSEQTYYFKVNEPETGFWSWFGDDEVTAKVDLEPGNYQIKLSELNAGGVSLSFYGAEGELLDSSTVTKIYPEFSAEFKRGKAKRGKK